MQRRGKTRRLLSLAMGLGWLRPRPLTVQISQSINMIHGGYMVLYCQLCNLVVCQLNRCLSSLVCFCEQWFGRASLKSRPGLGTHASVSWRECGICSSETRIWIPALLLLNSDPVCCFILCASLSSSVPPTRQKCDQNDVDIRSKSCFSPCLTY